MKRVFIKTNNWLPRVFLVLETVRLASVPISKNIIHLHGILWTDNREDIDNIWSYGYTWIPNEKKKVGERAVNYIIKYITKTDIKHSTYKPKILCSKGIGKGYLKKPQSKINKYNDKETKETYTTKQGYKIAMPIYYKNDIYTIS